MLLLLILLVFFMFCCGLVLFVLLFVQLAVACAAFVVRAFPVVYVATFCCFCCFVGRRQLNPTLVAFDHSKMSRTISKNHIPKDKV